MEGNGVNLAHQCGTDLCINNQWLAVTFCTEIHDSQRTDPRDFYYPLACMRMVWFMTTYLQNESPSAT